MKRLIEYIAESLIKEEISNEAKQIIEKLQKTNNLGEYVDDLNALLKDKDAKQILTKAFVSSGDDNPIELDAKMEFISVKDLHPTQNEIDVDKSLGYPFKGTKEAEVNMKEFFDNSDKVNMPFPLVTFQGEYILDGHHRWSQVYTFNPECKMQCFDITQSNGEKIDEQQALKICQGILAAKRAIDKKGSIPKNTVQGANLFKMNEKEVKEKIINYCEKNEDAAKIIEKYEKVNNAEKLADKLCENLMLLRKDNEKYANKGNERGVMPQTDKGGDDPEDMKTAKPDVKGSVLHAMSHAKINPKIV